MAGVKQLVAPRFWAKVRKTEFCWIWIASTSENGYGQFSLNKKPVRAHRVAYELIKGKIPEGMTLEHLCKNRLCVNPDHLEPVTLKENVLRGEGVTALLSRQTHCKNGHEFTEENTYIPRDPKNGKRQCRECKKVYQKSYQAKYKRKPQVNTSTTSLPTLT